MKSSPDKTNEIDSVKIQLIKAIRRHMSWVYSLYLLDNYRFASCSADNSINIYNLNNYELETTITGKSGVNYIAMLSNKYLASASDDIKIYDLNSKALLYTLNHHTHYVNKVSEISYDRMCSCSMDETLMIYDSFPPFRQKKALKGHKYPIISFIELKNKKYILSSSCNGEEMCIWNNKNYQCETYLVQTQSSLGPDVLLDMENNVVVAGGFQKVILFDMLTFRVKNTILINEIKGSIHCIIKFSNQVILCGSQDGCIIQINLKSNKIINIKYKAHDSWIFCLIKLDNNRLISCSGDKFVKIWKL